VASSRQPFFMPRVTRVTVFERSKHGLEGRGAGLVGQREIFAILRAVGCEHVARIGVVARERIFLDYGGQIIERHETPQMQISWDILFRSFRERLPDRNYLQGREVVSASEHGGAAYLTFSDGSTVEADLVIGVDGVGSIVRKAVAGDDAAPVYAGYAAWRGLYPEVGLAESAAENAARALCILQYASVPYTWISGCRSRWLS